MVNILYLLKILDTNKISELIENIDLAPLDLNLALGDAESAGDIEIDRAKDRIKALKKPEATFDSDLAKKLLRTMQQYEKKKLNITRGRMNNLIKDPATGVGYPYHEYIMALQYLIDSGQIEEKIEEVPELKDKRPYHKFVFLCFPNNPNDDWNRGVINNWIASFNKKK